MSNKILIISCNAIGDTYLSLSAFDYFEKRGYNVDIVCNNNTKFIMDNVGFRNIFYFEKKNIISLIKILVYLRKNKYDYTFTFFPGRFNTLLFKLVNSKNKSGYINYRRMDEWYDKSGIVTTKIKSDKNFVWNPEDNFLKRIELVLIAAGFDNFKLSKYIFPSNEQATSDNKTILIHLKSRSDKKTLGINDSIKLIDFLQQKLKQYKIIILDPDPEITNKINKVGEILILNNPDLFELLNKIKMCKVFIGVDSFPIHLADAYSKKIVGIFDSTYPQSVISDCEKILVVNKNNIDYNSILNFIVF